jgi:hypothetical protein
MKSVRILAPLALTVSLTLTACGGDGSSTTTSSTAATSSTSSTAPTTTTINVPPVSVPPSSSNSYLTGIAASHGASGDVVTFTFEGAIPGYSVSYESGTILSDPKGDPVTVAGGNNVKVVLSLATGVKLTGGYTKTYNGPDRFTPTGTSVVKELAKVGDFEGVLSWAIGTSVKRPFTVTTTANTVVITFAAA